MGLVVVMSLLCQVVLSDLINLSYFPSLSLQQAKELVNEILRERDHAGFGDRNNFGNQMGGGGGGGGGGGMDVSRIFNVYEMDST
jgi:hypothetical protein